MALPAPATLAEVRKSVFTRSLINTGGDRGARALALVDEAIRRAQRELTLEAPWTRLATEHTITLVANTSTYDFPDNMEPGRILDVFIRHASTGKYASLEACPSQLIRNAATSSSSSRAFYYWFSGEQINLTPTPDVTSWDQLRLDGYLRENDLVDDEDLVVVDKEAVIQRAAMFFRMDRGLPITDDMKNSHQAYLKKVRSAQAEAGSVVMGGNTSAKCMPEDDSLVRGSAHLAYDSSWVPPGFPPTY